MARQHETSIDATKRWIVDHFIHKNPLSDLIHRIDEIFESIQWNEIDGGNLKGTITIAVNGLQILEKKEIIINGPFDDGRDDDDTDWNYENDVKAGDITGDNHATFRKRATIAIRNYFINVNIISAFAYHVDEILERENLMEKISRRAASYKNPPDINLYFVINDAINSEICDFPITMIGNDHGC